MDEPVVFESWIDRQIREATERGEFSGLRGEGKPIDLGRPGQTRPWIVDRMEREDLSGVLPEPLALRREKEELRQTLTQVRREDEAKELIDDLNRRIMDSNLNPREPRIITGLVDVEAALCQWRTDRRIL